MKFYRMAGHNPWISHLDFGAIRIWIRIQEFLEEFYHCGIGKGQASSSRFWQQFGYTPANGPQTEQIKGCLGGGLRSLSAFILVYLFTYLLCPAPKRGIKR